VWASQGPLQAAERLEPVGLEELDAAAALRRRFDTKYLMPREAAGELLARLAATHRVLEIGGLRAFEYRTTYFDTQELATFRDHLQGRRRRLKARVRRYVESGDCFFEVKLGAGRIRPLRTRAARAGAEVDFRRTRLVALGRGERLTIDVDVRMRTPAGGGSGRLDSGLALVESKSPRGPALATRDLNLLGARRLDGMSKYCLGVVLALGRGRGNALLPVLRHCTAGSAAA
jgi:hypothetical protein